MLNLLIWWLALQLFAVVALPITLKLLRFLPDRGLGFTRQVGLLLAGYLFWLLNMLGFLQNTRASMLLVMAALAAISLWLWRRNQTALRDALRARWRLVAITEGLFLVALAAFALFRAFNPEIAATEKPMEFAFINGILRSRTFPPNDPWLSGYAISYYYFGYVLIAMLTRLTGIASDITFNLAGATLFALVVSGAFSLVSNLAQAYLARRDEVRATVLSRAAVLAGLLGSVLVALMGNLEGIFELIRARGGGSEALWRWLDVKNLQATPPSARWYPDDMWWWWRASRVIHDRDAFGNSMEVIDEFPFFSFLLGDNHPHVLALPFVLLILALVLNVLLSRHHDCPPVAKDTTGSGWLATGRSALRALWPGSVLEWVLWAICIGSLGFLNTWDLPIYLAIFALAYALYRHRCGGGRWAWLGDTFSLGLILMVASIVLYLPFYISFRSQAGGIGWVGDIKTRLHQYLLMFGVFVAIQLGVMAKMALRYAGAPKGERRLPLLAQAIGGLAGVAMIVCVALGWWTAAVLALLVGGLVALLVWGTARQAEHPSPDVPGSGLDAATQFALLIAAMGLLLTLSTEFVFLRDTFGTRMNTIFKFYYQAWVLLGLASAYGIFYLAQGWRQSRPPARIATAIWLGLCALLVGAGLSYAVAATASKANGFAGTPTLDGTRYVAQYHPDDYAAIQWLRAHAPEGAVMVEAPGGSYSEYNWVSAHTGIPTLLGWGGHELQWRGNYDEPGRREPDIAAIYQTTDVAQLQRLLDTYGVDYVYVGRLERAKYRLNQPMVAKFDRAMVRLFEQGEVVIYGRSR
jgi:YYY domain-containing protein